MWSAKSEIADLYLSGKTLAVWTNGSAAIHPLAEDWVSSLQSSLGERARRRWRIWLGGSRCGLHLCEPIAGVHNIEEAEAALSALLGASLSLGASTVSVRLATWSAAPEPWLALATEAGLVERLMATVEDGDGHVHSIRPWWTIPSIGNAAGAAMCDGEAITYWRVDERGAVTSAATLLVAQDQQAASLQRLRVGGALCAWRLALDAEQTAGAVGMAATPMDEGADASA